MMLVEWSPWNVLVSDVSCKCIVAPSIVVITAWLDKKIGLDSNECLVQRDTFYLGEYWHLRQDELVLELWGEIEGSEKAGSRQELNPGHLWLEPPVLCPWATIYANQTTTNPLYVVILNASVAHLAATQYVLSENSLNQEFRCYEAKIAVHMEDCEGWWLSGCCSSVAEHWRLKPEVFWVRLLAAAGLFTFLHLCNLSLQKFQGIPFGAQLPQVCNCYIV